LYRYLDTNNDWAIDDRKWYLKKRAFETVADQTGKLFDPNVLTIVWARRFAGYKRADLLTYDMQRFDKMLSNTKYPVQIIWAGKPYPQDYPAITQFNQLVHLSKKYKNVSVLVGYELLLSRRLKQAADIWLNNPRVPREASGTSGMTASMNGAINFSTDDGWIPEFAKPGVNSFVVPQVDYANMTTHDQDQYDLNKVYEMLENEIIPMYYENKDAWRTIVKNGMTDVRVQFDSNRIR
jgi:starch phosphorylase